MTADQFLVRHLKSIEQNSKLFRSKQRRVTFNYSLIKSNGDDNELDKMVEIDETNGHIKCSTRNVNCQ